MYGALVVFDGVPPKPLSERYAGSERPGVFFGYGHGVGHRIGRDDVGLRNFKCERHRNAAAAGAQIQNLRRVCGDDERLFDQDFRIGAGDEHRIGDVKPTAVELLPSRKVRERNARVPQVDKRAEFQKRFGLDDFVVVRNEKFARFAEHVSEERQRFEPADDEGRLLQGLADDLRFRVRGRHVRLSLNDRAGRADRPDAESPGPR